MVSRSGGSRVIGCICFQAMKRISRISRVYNNKHENHDVDDDDDDDDDDVDDDDACKKNTQHIHVTGFPLHLPLGATHDNKT